MELFFHSFRCKQGFQLINFYDIENCYVRYKKCYFTLGEMKLTRMLTKETSNISTGGNKFFPLAGQKQNSRISPLRDCKEFLPMNRKRKCEKKKKKKKKEEEEKKKKQK